MSWRRGELWLDTDLLWFREAAAAPAVPVLAPASFPSLTQPPGLAASLRKREAWKQRRSARRARTKAIMLSPAVVLVLAGLRSASDDRAAAEDPPSATFRLTGETVQASDGPVEPIAGRDGVGLPFGLLPALSPKRSHRINAKDQKEHQPPRIEWHRATSVGLPYGGSLIHGTQLPVEGSNWITWDPVDDHLLNAPRRLYGNERTIRTIVSVARSYRAANPRAPRIVIGDISREGGGPMLAEHVSHQNGLDVDVYYPRRDHKLRTPLTPGEIDRRLAQDLLDRFVAAGAQMIFVGYSTGLSGPAGVVIPYSNHENHMHVRFPQPQPGG
jgi:Penicillin-insensitive murein endopeptidase